MRRFPWVPAGLAIACAMLAACSSSPKAPRLEAAAAFPLQADCGISPSAPGREPRLSCRLIDTLPDAQIDPAHPGSAACNQGSYSVFKQSVDVPVRLAYAQKSEDGPMQVRFGGVVGPGTHAAKVGKSTGNDCDTILGKVSTLSARFSGTYVAVVDTSQKPFCVAQSSLALNAFDQMLSVPQPVNLTGVARESASDAMQKRLDLEVAIQANRFLQPSARPLSEAVVARNGRCPEGFRTFTGR